MKKLMVAVMIVLFAVTAGIVVAQTAKPAYACVRDVDC